MTRNAMLDALRDYMTLRERIANLEAHESECRCDANEFHTCDLCREVSELDHQVRIIMQNWGEEFAVALARYENIHAEVTQ